MTEPIQPALTAEEWADNGHPAVDGYMDWQIGIVDVSSHYAADSSRFIPGLIALANAALSDNDPRKITRRMIAEMEACADEADSQTLHEYAVALASLLPPEKPPT